MKSRGTSSRRSRDLQLSNFLGRPARIVMVIVLLAVILFPMYWLVSNSFKQEQEYYHSPPIMFPHAGHRGELRRHRGQQGSLLRPAQLAC